MPNSVAVSSIELDTFDGFELSIGKQSPVVVTVTFAAAPSNASLRCCHIFKRDGAAVLNNSVKVQRTTNANVTPAVFNVFPRGERALGQTLHFVAWDSANNNAIAIPRMSKRIRIKAPPAALIGKKGKKNKDDKKGGKKSGKKG